MKSRLAVRRSRTATLAYICGLVNRLHSNWSLNNGNSRNMAGCALYFMSGEEPQKKVSCEEIINKKQSSPPLSSPVARINKNSAILRRYKNPRSISHIATFFPTRHPHRSAHPVRGRSSTSTSKWPPSACPVNSSRTTSTPAGSSKYARTTCRAESHAYTRAVTRSARATATISSAPQVRISRHTSTPYHTGPLVRS